MKKFLYLIIMFIFTACGNTDKKSGVIIPAYFYDGFLWEKVVSVSGPDRFVVIINPDYGPGDEVDGMYKNVVEDLNGTSKTPVGYVYTKWGGRNISDVENDINRWIELYPGVRGFFIDEANSSKEDLDYYKTLYEFIKKKGNYFVVLNPGTKPDAGYYDVSDLIVVFENDVSELNDNVCGEYFDKSAAIVYGADEEQMLKYKNVCSYVYFTDDSGNNPYDTLPSYFDEEINELK
jgi:hypothetical protein